MNFDLEEYRNIEIAEYMAKTRPSFTKDALCRGTIYSEIELALERSARRGNENPVDISTTFFPSRGGASKVAQAKKICEKCPVQWDCFEYAYDGYEQAGIWGGSSIEELERSHKKNMEPDEAFIALFGIKQFKRKSK